MKDGISQIIATAIHHGHELRDEVRSLMALDERDRLREEDPFTGIWTAVAETRFIGLRSRFEVDLNRPREKAVYLKPEDCWGLNVWKQEPSAELIARSLAQYDGFYEQMRRVCREAEKRFGRFVIFDLHSYNHRRDGADAQPACAEENPEVNVGTGTMNRDLWEPVIERFMNDLRSFDFLGRRLDVRENVRFKGGNLAAWTHKTFPETGCALALEFKKFWMDEWTGQPDHAQVAAIGAALASTVAGVLEELNRR